MSREYHLDALGRRRPAPEFEGNIPLENHFVGDELREPDLGRGPANRGKEDKKKDGFRDHVAIGCMKLQFIP
jgi:hypothetical protein